MYDQLRRSVADHAREGFGQRPGGSRDGELLREVYDTADRHEARFRLRRFYVHCESSDVVELERLARTIRRRERKSSPGTPPVSPTAPPRPSTSW